jgi:hypothetical protein
MSPQNTIQTAKAGLRTVEENTALAVGKKGAEFGGGAIAGAGFSESIALASTLGLMAAVSAGITQWEYGHERKQLRDFYKDEIAAKLGKDPKSVNDRDMDALAKGAGREANHTIAGMLRKLKRQRNVGIVVSTVATLGTYGIMHTPAIIATALPFLGSVIVGLSIYYAIKKPLHYLADKAFGLNKETTHDRIADIQKDRDAGKTISREQVISVFVAANPELSAFIKSQYGKEFDKLDVAHKLRITENIGKLVHIDELTDSLNLGHIRVAELAFAAEGQASGVKPTTQDAHKTGLISTIKGKLHDLVRRAAHHGGELHHQPQEAMVYDAPEEPRRSFTERLGVAKAHTGMGHVERLEQSRGELPGVQR